MSGGDLRVWKIQLRFAITVPNAFESQKSNEATELILADIRLDYSRDLGKSEDTSLAQTLCQSYHFLPYSQANGDLFLGELSAVIRARWTNDGGERRIAIESGRSRPPIHWRDCEP
jgi:hypothetical protein